jgi:hypothetical protein
VEYYLEGPLRVVKVVIPVKTGIQVQNNPECSGFPPARE